MFYGAETSFGHHLLTDKSNAMFDYWNEVRVCHLVCSTLQRVHNDLKRGGSNRMLTSPLLDKDHGSIIKLRHTWIVDWKWRVNPTANSTFRRRRPWQCLKFDQFLFHFAQLMLHMLHGVALGWCWSRFLQFYQLFFDTCKFALDGIQLDRAQANLANLFTRFR